MRNTPYGLFGVEVGVGWTSLIEPLFELCAKEGVEVVQVKEKFGGLRFYVSNASEELYKAIDKAETESFHICEHCGAPGKLGGKGWIKTLCEPCRKKWDDERNNRAV